MGEEAKEVEELLPDKVICQWEEKIGLGLDWHFLEEKTELTETGQEEEAATPSVVPERDGTNIGKIVYVSC